MLYNLVVINDLVKAGHDPFARISVDEFLKDIMLEDVNNEENVNEEENDEDIFSLCAL